MHVVDRHLLLGVARILLGLFSTQHAKDENGKCIPDMNRHKQGFACMLVYYPTHIRPRDAEKAEVIGREFERR
jgi:hypothetical protein